MAVASAITLAACGEKQTMASKSAAAYREAQAKDVPVAVDHSSMDHSTMTGMDHSTMDHSTTTHAGHTTMDHSTMDHSKMTHAEHSTMTGAAHENMTGMDHGVVDHSSAHPAIAHAGHTAAPDHAAMPGMHQHTTSTPVAAVTVTPTPRSSTDVERLDPAATLSPDDFDAPAPTAVEEAQKAAGDAHAGHAMPPAKKEQR